MMTGGSPVSGNLHIVIGVMFRNFAIVLGVPPFTMNSLGPAELSTFLYKLYPVGAGFEGGPDARLQLAVPW